MALVETEPERGWSAGALFDDGCTIGGRCSALRMRELAGRMKISDTKVL